jgi:hypothetical protein
MCRRHGAYGQSSVDRYLDFDLRVICDKPVDDWPKDGLGSVFRAGDPDRTRGALAQRREVSQARRNFVERRPHALDQVPTGVGRRDLARGPGQEPDAETGLEPADGVAQR